MTTLMALGMYFIGLVMGLMLGYGLNRPDVTTSKDGL